jgi:hypothetical protein
MADARTGCRKIDDRTTTRSAGLYSHRHFPSFTMTRPDISFGLRYSILDLPFWILYS